MKKLRRIAFVLAFAAFIGCVILLLNFTAPNPTGRRYSSRVILTSGNPQTVGRDAENVLGLDLRLPNNNDPDQRQCICGNPSYANTGDCRVCLAISASIDTYRIPDFVAPGFIAEAKNRAGLPYSGRDADQISDFVIASQALNRPLWLYIRVNTDLDPSYMEMVEATGGGVVRYFATADYADPVDTGARNGVVVSIVILAGTIFWSALGSGGVRVASPRPRGPQSPLDKALKSSERAASFGKSATDRLRSKLDEPRDD